MARDALERSRAPDDAIAVRVALQTGDGAWVALVDRDNWGAVRSARERACSAALDDALRNEDRARAACAIAKRRFDGFERHRGRALEAFRAQEERREETERDETRVCP
jgi:AmiR/NasT family two-component response regulator